MGLRKLFIEHGTSVQVPKGSVVSLTGSSEGTIFFVLDGQVMLQSSSHEGKEFAFEFLGPGMTIGLLDLAVDVTALTECKLAKMHIRDFWHEVSGRGDVSFELLQNVVRILRKRTVQLHELALSNLDARLAQTIIKQFEAEGVLIERGARAPLPTQALLAKILACSRESANKELQRLRNSNVINICGRQMQIVDPEKLVRWASFGSAAFRTAAAKSAKPRDAQPARLAIGGADRSERPILPPTV